MLKMPAFYFTLQKEPQLGQIKILKHRFYCSIIHLYTNVGVAQYRSSEIWMLGQTRENVSTNSVMRKYYSWFQKLTNRIITELKHSTSVSEAPTQGEKRLLLQICSMSRLQSFECARQH